MRTLAALLLLALPANAEEDLSQYGTTNPEEMTLERLVERAEKGDVDMMVCANGYLATKAGRHDKARIIFEACANKGWTQAMNWMSQLDHNGLGADEDPDRATEWSRRASELGDAVGTYNHGIDMIRGRGVAQDVARGRALVDRAAAEGLGIARRLQAAEYDLDEVTPDADAWKYAPMF